MRKPELLVPASSHEVLKIATVFGAYYSNILGPINAQLGNISYVLCAIVGGVLAIGNRRCGCRQQVL